MRPVSRQDQANNSEQIVGSSRSNKAYHRASSTCAGGLRARDQAHIYGDGLMLPLGSMAGTIESAADFLLPRHECVSMDKTAQEAIEETGKKQVDDAPAGLLGWTHSLRSCNTKTIPTPRNSLIATLGWPALDESKTSMMSSRDVWIFLVPGNSEPDPKVGSRRSGSC